MLVEGHWESVVIKTIAVVGATGAVGQIVLEEIEKQQLSYEKIKLLASPRSAGKCMHVGGRSVQVEVLRPEAFDGVDLVISSTPDEVAAECVPWAVERGAIVVDESAYFRMKPEVPLVVPEVNPEAIARHKGIIASPNCSTTQLVVALKPLMDAAGLRRVIVSTYQAVSGAGLAAQQELIANTQASLSGNSPLIENFQHDIALNLIPQIGSHKEDGFTSEELKMVHETHKILGDGNISINATCVRVPVLIGHSESVYCETERPMSLDEIKQLFLQAPGITLIDDLSQKAYPMPRDCQHKPDVFIGRVRKDRDVECGISFWCVSDNLRKGAATNAVQIGKLLTESAAGGNSAESLSINCRL